MTLSEEHTKHFIYLLRRVFLRSSLWIELSYCFLSHVHLYILSFHLKQQHCFAQLHLIMTNPFTFFQFLLFYTQANFSLLFKGVLQLKLQTYSVFHIFFPTYAIISINLLFFYCLCSLLLSPFPMHLKPILVFLTILPPFAIPYQNLSYKVKIYHKHNSRQSSVT